MLPPKRPTMTDTSSRTSTDLGRFCDRRSVASAKLCANPFGSQWVLRRAGFVPAAVWRCVGQGVRTSFKAITPATGRSRKNIRRRVDQLHVSQVEAEAAGPSWCARPVLTVPATPVQLREEVKALPGDPSHHGRDERIGSAGKQSEADRVVLRHAHRCPGQDSQLFPWGVGYLPDHRVYLKGVAALPQFQRCLEQLSDGCGSGGRSSPFVAPRRAAIGSTATSGTPPCERASRAASVQAARSSRPAENPVDTITTLPYGKHTVAYVGRGGRMRRSDAPNKCGPWLRHLLVIAPGTGGRDRAVAHHRMAPDAHDHPRGSPHRPGDPGGQRRRGATDHRVRPIRDTRAWHAGSCRPYRHPCLHGGVSMGAQSHVCRGRRDHHWPSRSAKPLASRVCGGRRRDHDCVCENVRGANPSGPYGSAYEGYKAEVPRWIPKRPRPRKT